MIPAHITDIQTHTHKLVKTLRDKLLGMQYVNPEFKYVLRAFRCAQIFHESRLRKDGVTPEFLHPVQATLHLITLGPLINPLEAIGGLIIHDYPEDSGKGEEELFQEIQHRAIARKGVEFSKIKNGKKLDNQEYYETLGLCPSLSLGKGCDRVNNLGTMGSCMSPEKQLIQADETMEFVLPMLRRAQRRFPEQEAAYENLKLMLLNQVFFVRAAHDH